MVRGVDGVGGGTSLADVGSRSVSGSMCGSASFGDRLEGQGERPWFFVRIFTGTWWLIRTIVCFRVFKWWRISGRIKTYRNLLELSRNFDPRTHQPWESNVPNHWKRAFERIDRTTQAHLQDAFVGKFVDVERRVLCLALRDHSDINEIEVQGAIQEALLDVIDKFEEEIS